ncbi:MAG: mechanosensitive ion channel family protein [Chloroflexi bacterium]|nr:mechanosensitive ion channel family protein [Chloroflexota bacterium]
MSFIDLSRAEWLELLIALAIFGVGFSIAFVARGLVRTVVSRITRSNESHLNELLARALRPPLTFLFLLVAVAVAVRSISFLEGELETPQRIWLALTLLMVVIAVQRTISAILTWLSVRPTTSPDARLNSQSLPLVRRGVNFSILLIGGLIMLDAVGVQISPLLAGLGIGGLAVALALQPLLANVFASSYMLSDASVRVGDLIEIAGGPVGTVEDIGWRATRIMNFDNNMVMIPNSRLADATITNYSSSDSCSDARVDIGVAYEEDLERVEAVCRDVLTALRDAHEVAVKDADPVMRFTGFGESNIEIMMKLRAITWADSFALRHELIKRIHARFLAEGITVNYPTRRLFLQAEDASALTRSAPDT